MEEKWINKLRKKMESHQAPEPSGLWDDIEAALNVKKPVPIANYRKVLLWSSIGGVAALLALILLLGRGSNSLLTIPANIEVPTAKQYIPIPKTDTERNTNEIIQQVEKKKVLLAANTSTSDNNQKTSENKTQTNAAVSNKQDILENIIENKELEENKEIDEKKTNNTPTQPAEENKPEKKESFAIRETDFGPIDSYNYRGKAKDKNRLTASVYSNNLPNSSGQSSGYGELIKRTTLSSTQISGSNVEEQEPAKDIVFSNIGQETHTKTKHKQPVKAGLSIRYQLNDKFGIESGMTYTYLSSDLTSGTEKNLYETEQSLQYIGIPLNVSYNIWDNENWGFYVTAGGLAEKSIAGKTRTDYIINNKIVSSEDGKIKEKPLQLSVNSSIGMQYNLSSKLGLFVEPGVSYYFNNGSDIETIYKEKPFNINFKIGVRVNIK